MYKYFELDPKNPLKSNDIYKINAYIFTKFPRVGDKGDAIPKFIFELKNLVYLDLSNQSITSVPDEIEKLTQLNELILDNCIKLKEISAKIADLPLKNISLVNCLSLQTPPAEIIRRGTDSIISYMKRLSSGSVLCKRTKLMLVGLGLLFMFNFNSILYKTKRITI